MKFARLGFAQINHHRGGRQQGRIGRIGIFHREPRPALLALLPGQEESQTEGQSLLAIFGSLQRIDDGEHFIGNALAFGRRGRRGQLIDVPTQQKAREVEFGGVVGCRDGPPRFLDGAVHVAARQAAHHAQTPRRAGVPRRRKFIGGELQLFIATKRRSRATARLKILGRQIANRRKAIPIAHRRWHAEA